MPTDRPLLAAALDEDTLDRWRDFANQHGLTVAALIEGMGRHLPAASGRLPRWLAVAVAEARKVQAERKDRRPRE